MLRKEVAVLSRFQGHPNLVHLYGVSFKAESVADDGVERSALFRCVIETEYCSGGDLVTEVTKARYPEQKAELLIGQLLQGLAHVHEHGFVHRDVKPENVLLTHEGVPKLADFGLCCELSDTEEMKRRCGSPGYVAPEVCLCQPYNQKVDSFGAGALLYFIISGKRPFRGSCIESIMARTIRNEVNFQRSLRLECLSESCKDFIRRLMEKDPGARPTAQEALYMMTCTSQIRERDFDSDENFSHRDDSKSSGLLSEFAAGSASASWKLSMFQSEAPTTFCESVASVGTSPRTTECSTARQSDRLTSHLESESYTEDPLHSTTSNDGFTGASSSDMALFEEWRPSMPRTGAPSNRSPAVRKLRNFWKRSKSAFGSSEPKPIHEEPEPCLEEEKEALNVDEAPSRRGQSEETPMPVAPVVPKHPTYKRTARYSSN
jgi:serine/threonine protein kinase